MLLGYAHPFVGFMHLRPSNIFRTTTIFVGSEKPEISS
jgi:hypothetical protein